MYINEKNEFVVNKDEVKCLIAFAEKPNGYRDHLAGALFVPQKGHTVATDGHALVQLVAAGPDGMAHKGAAGPEFFVPVAVLKSAASIMRKKTDEATMHGGGGMLTVKVGTSVLGGAEDENRTKFPPYEQVIPEGEPNGGCSQFGIDPKLFAKLALFVTACSSKGCKLSTSQDPLGPIKATLHRNPSVAVIMPFRAG